MGMTWTPQRIVVSQGNWESMRDDRWWQLWYTLPSPHSVTSSPVVFQFSVTPQFSLVYPVISPWCLSFPVTPHLWCPCHLSMVFQLLCNTTLVVSPVVPPWCPVIPPLSPCAPSKVSQKFPSSPLSLCGLPMISPQSLTCPVIPQIPFTPNGLHHYLPSSAIVPWSLTCPTILQFWIIHKIWGTNKKVKC